MSNFQTLSLVTGGIPGTAARIYSAVTTDTYATVVTAGYVTDLSPKEVKTDDVFFIRYLDGQTGAALQMFKVAADGVTLIPLGASNGLITGSASYAGGSPTATITDARITAGMRGVASFDSQTTPASVLTVNPGTGNIVVVASADPGASVINYMVFSLV